MKHRAFALALTAAAIVTPALAGEPRAVIELFTSQGCSSCPAADKLLGQLRQDPSVLALSLPVDYWDYLGWKDTLALHGHTVRQKAYAEARGDREVYTPQVVVNGVVHALGNDKAAIDKAIEETRAKAAALTVPVTLHVADGKLTVNVAEAASAAGGKAEIWLCPYASTIPVNVERGENRGHTLTYYDVVRRWVKLGDFTGKAESYTLPVADVTKGESDVDHVAVLVQREPEGKPGLMLGAAAMSLR
ncbi:MAG: DUF1223 domain-containing protein [Pseudolabrys sp.]